MTDALDERPAMLELSFKPWCAARQTMAATQALKEIIASGVAPSAIEEVTVEVLPPHLKMIDHGVVAGDRVSHLTSVQYCMAVAALAPEAAFDIQQAPAKIPSAVQALMAKIKVQADERLLAEYPRSWPARRSTPWPVWRSRPPCCDGCRSSRSARSPSGRCWPSSASRRSRRRPPPTPWPAC